MTKQQKKQAGVANDINNGHTASMNNTRTEMAHRCSRHLMLSVTPMLFLRRRAKLFEKRLLCFPIFATLVINI